jgi:hypothetical protein
MPHSERNDRYHEFHGYHAFDGIESSRVYDPATPAGDTAPSEGYKVGGVSYDKLLNDLLDAHPPEEFFLEHLRRLGLEVDPTARVLRKTRAFLALGSA